jgi:hypothetical protein
MSLSHDGGRRDAQTGNAGNAQGSGCLAMTSAPTDDELGMKWWNELSERERAHWASAAGTGRAKDAWELWKAGPLATGADDPLADAHAALLRAIAELRALGITVPIALHQAVRGPQPSWQSPTGRKRQPTFAIKRPMAKPGIDGVLLDVGVGSLRPQRDAKSANAALSVAIYRPAGRFAKFWRD